MTQIAGYIGLCLRAGKAVSGTATVEQTVKRGRAKLVLMDPCIAEGTGRTIRKLCAKASVPCGMLEEAGLIEQLTSRAERKVLAVTDEGFAGMIRGKMQDEAFDTPESL